MKEQAEKDELLKQFELLRNLIQTQKQANAEMSSESSSSSGSELSSDEEDE